jgi:hypothetical protein
MLGELVDTGVLCYSPASHRECRAAAAPPSSAMNSRRRNLLNCICGSYASDGGKLQNIW